MRAKVESRSMPLSFPDTDAAGLKPKRGQPLHWTTDLVQKFWDYQSDRPETYFTTQFGPEIVREIRTFVPRGARILDYACGTGGLTKHLLEGGFAVAASDISLDSLKVVEEKFRNHSRFLGVSQTHELRALRTRFHAVVLVELMEHVKDDALDLVFMDVDSVLEPGGVVIVTCPNDEDLTIETVYCPCCDHTFHRWQHVRSWSPTSLEDLFICKKLLPVSMRTLDFALSPRNGRVRFWAKRLLAPLRRRRPPHLMGVARKPFLVNEQP